MVLKTLQVAILGGSDDAVLVGLRDFPVHKLILLALGDSAEQADRLSRKLVDTLRLDVEVVCLKDPTIPTMLETVSQRAREHPGTPCVRVPR